MIYFIQAGEDGPVKIGRAKSPVRRMGTLQHGSPVELHLRALIDTGEESDLPDERSLHRRFEHVRLRGEWFEPCDELMTLVDEIFSYAWNDKFFGLRGHQLMERRR